MAEDREKKLCRKSENYATIKVETLESQKTRKSKEVWRACVRKARPLVTSRNSNQKQTLWSESEDCIQIYVTDPNYLYRLCTEFPFVCKIGEQPGCGPALLHEVCKERGWKEFQPDPDESSENPGISSWNLWWQYGKTAISAGRSLFSWQMANFMDHKYNFTNKDVCSRFLMRLQKSYGSGFDFGPMSFNLPNDYPRLCSEHSKRTKKEFMGSIRSSSAGPQRRSNFRDRHPSDEPIWICKPVGKSRGRGITVFDTVTKLSYHTQSVVQEYISRPYLIGGYKWDLRIYVCIVSTNPLVIYAYREGIVRFATDQFTLKNLYNPYAHLTNTSLNKGSPSYRHPKEVIGVGCKWTLRKLRRHWFDNNVNDWYLWQRILKILILTIVGDADNIAAMSNPTKTFSVFGFDIMVDINMKPYLLEVNKNPALGHDCEVDTIVKKPMLHDLFDLLGLPNIRHFQEAASHHGSYSSDLIETPSFPFRLLRRPGDNNINIRSWQFENAKNENSSWCKAGANIQNNYEDSVDNNNNIANSSKMKEQNPYYRIVGPPGNRRIDPPILVKIPIRKKGEKQRAKEYEAEGLAGLVLSVRNWSEMAPTQVGDWTRIFPFDNLTDGISRSGTGFDIRRVTNHVNEYMQTARKIFKTHPNSNYADMDETLRQMQNLDVPIWHPDYTLKSQNQKS